MGTDPFEEFGSTLSSSTTTDIGRDWIEPLKDGAPDWPDQPLGRSDTGLDGVTQYPGLEADQEQEVPPHKFAGEETPKEPSRPRMSPKAALYQINLLGATEDLREGRKYTERRANLAFGLMLAFGVSGVIAALVGIGLLWAGVIAPGNLTLIGSLFAGESFRRSRRMYEDERDDLKEIRKNLRVYKKARLDLIVATQIADRDDRDKAIRSILKRGDAVEAEARSNG